MKHWSIFCWVIFFNTYLSADDSYPLIKRAADLFQKEKLEIKTYKVTQDVTSTIKENKTTIVEQRIQTGYFKSPEEYIFITKELELNGIKQILTKPLVERTTKSEIDWLSKLGLTSHSFQLLSSDNKLTKYLVSPLKIQAGYYRGQIWINPQNAKIVKILKEPIIKKREMMKYSLELNFEMNYTYQMPSHTNLTAIYQKENQSTEVKVDVNFKDYQFNIDLTKELPK